MLSQLPPSGNHSYSSFTSPTRSNFHSNSTRPSASNLPSLTQTPSQSNSNNNSTTQQPQQPPQPPSPYSTTPMNQSTPQQSTHSGSNTTNNTPFSIPQSSSEQNVNNLVLLPPLPLPQLGDISSYSQSTQFQQQQPQHSPLNNTNNNDNNQNNSNPIENDQYTQQFDNDFEEFPPDQIVERALLEDSFIEHGLLAVDKNVSILGEILNLSEGRDKLFKFGAAILKIIKYALTNWLPKTSQTDDILGRIKSCSTATSTTRLFLKLCTDWVFFRLAARVYYQQRAGTLKVFTLSRLLGMAFYFTFQVPLWLQATGLVKQIDKSFWLKLSLRSYIVSVCSQLFMDFRKAIDLTKEIGYWQLTVPGEALEQYQATHGIDSCNNNTITTTTTTNTTKNQPTSPIINGNNNSPTVNNINNGTKSPSLVPSSSLSNLSSTTKSSTSIKSQIQPQPPPTTIPDSTSELHPEYALSFRRRLTPTTARYQALLQRTLWQQNVQAQLALTRQPPQSNSSPTSPQGMFSSLLSLPTTLNNGFNQLKEQIVGNLPQHPYLLAQDQRAAFNEQLKQLQDETRMALVRENMLQKDRNKLFVNFLKDGGDLFGALDGLYDWGHSDLTLGLISLISSSISIYRMWARYKQTVEKSMLEEAREALRKQQDEEEEQRRIEEERSKLEDWVAQVQQYYSTLQQQQVQQQIQQLQQNGSSVFIEQNGNNVINNNNRMNNNNNNNNNNNQNVTSFNYQQNQFPQQQQQPQIYTNTNINPYTNVVAATPVIMATSQPSQPSQQQQQSQDKNKNQNQSTVNITFHDDNILTQLSTNNNTTTNSTILAQLGNNQSHNQTSILSQNESFQQSIQPQLQSHTQLQTIGQQQSHDQQQQLQHHQHQQQLMEPQIILPSSPTSPLPNQGEKRIVRAMSATPISTTHTLSTSTNTKTVADNTNNVIGIQNDDDLIPELTTPATTTPNNIDLEHTTPVKSNPTTLSRSPSHTYSNPHSESHSITNTNMTNSSQNLKTPIRATPVVPSTTNTPQQQHEQQQVDNFDIDANNNNNDSTIHNDQNTITTTPSTPNNEMTPNSTDVAPTPIVESELTTSIVSNEQGDEIDPVEIVQQDEIHDVIESDNDIDNDENQFSNQSE